MLPFGLFIVCVLVLRTRSDVLRTWDGARGRAYVGVGGMADTSGYGGRAPARARGLMERRGAAGGAGARARVRRPGRRVAGVASVASSIFKALALKIGVFPQEKRYFFFIFYKISKKFYKNKEKKPWFADITVAVR